MLGDITPEIKEAYEWTPYARVAILRDALRDQLAAKLKLEFESEHQVDGRGDLRWCSRCQWGAGTENIDPRHNYDDSAWQAEAERLLTEGE